MSTQLSVINEVIPLTGTFFSGSSQFYTKNYLNIVSGSYVSGGFFTTVYDGSPSSLSSSALIDLTYGHSTASLLSTFSATFENAQKQRIYQEMANYLLGSQGGIFNFNSTNYNELFFLSFKRRIFKDEIQKGTVNIAIQTSGGVNDGFTLSDTGAASVYSTGKAGDFAALYSGSTPVGAVYYDAGIVAFATGVFVAPVAPQSVYWSGSAPGTDLNQVTISGNLDNIVYGLMNRLNNVQFQNQTNLHSTLYFCRALNGDFNFSSNPTFVDSTGRIIPTSGSNNLTRTYITSVGLYDVNNNLLAVAKLSQPVKKSFDAEVSIRVRLSY